MAQRVECEIGYVLEVTGLIKDIYKISLSQNFEQYLEEVVFQKNKEEWEKENKKAIDAYNNEIVENGVFSDGLRSF